MTISSYFKNLESKIVAWRREFHERPELPYREEKTSARIQEELKKWGIPFETVKTNIPAELWMKFGLPREIVDNSFGIIAKLDGEGKAGHGKKFALRADIDALPMNEETPVPFKSKNPGAMHSCGHDAHIAMLLGAAHYLTEHRGEFSGTLYLCFQPAEEIGGGAPEIVEYLQKRGGVDGAAGLHIFANQPAGKIILKEGPVMAGLFGFNIILKGQGGHGSRPDMVRDPIKAAADLIQKLSQIPSNFYDVMDNAALHVCMVNAGTAVNIFPDTATVGGGARFFKLAGYDRIVEAIRRIAKGVALANNVEAEVNVTPALEPVINNAEFIKRARGIVEQIDGLEVLEVTEPIGGSDNFSKFLTAFPGFYGILGGANDALGINFDQHSSRFDLDEAALAKGSEFLCRCALDFLK